jgi:hypothetical protein
VGVPPFGEILTHQVIVGDILPERRLLVKLGEIPEDGIIDMESLVDIGKRDEQYDDKDDADTQRRRPAG